MDEFVRNGGMVDETPKERSSYPKMNGKAPSSLEPRPPHADH